MRKVVVAVVTALLAGMPAVAARAAECPSGVTGTQPSYAAIRDYLATSAASHGIPVAILRAVAYQESRWVQFANGTVLVSSDGACGLGIMQVTASESTDQDRLAGDWEFNVDEGARILRAKWDLNQNGTPPPDGYSADDPHVLDNWYYALCLYNGCSGSDVYASAVANIVADPFRYAESPVRAYLTYGGFTKPAEAKHDYVFPNAFQAQYSPTQQFVFYDYQTGDVTEIDPAYTHDDRVAHPVYGAGTYGPDGPGVACIACIYWRLAEGKGAIGRAHWTKSVAGSGVARVTWTPALPRTGLYKVTATISDVAVDAEPMGAVTYHLPGDVMVTRDQSLGNSVLGTYTLSPGNTVWVDDDVPDDVAGRRIVADAMNFAAVTALSLTANTGTVVYGSRVLLTARLTHQGTTAGLASRPVKLYKRKVGVSSWTYAATYSTNATGYVSAFQTPSSNAEYQFVYAGAGDATYTASPVRRVYVRTSVGGTLSRTTVAHGQKLTAFTSVAPAHSGQTVIWQRYYGGVWHNLLARTLVWPSNASYTFAVSTPGTYKYRWYKPSDSDHVTGWSATLTLTVT